MSFIYSLVSSFVIVFHKKSFLVALVTIHFHCMKKSSLDILLNFSFWVPCKKELDEKVKQVSIDMKGEFMFFLLNMFGQSNFFNKSYLKIQYVFLYFCWNENPGLYPRSLSKSAISWPNLKTDIYSAYVNTSRLPLCAFSNHNRFSTDT